MEVLDRIPFELDMGALLSKLHVEKDSEDAVALQRLVDRALPVVRPKAIYRVAYVLEKGQDTVNVEGVVFTSRVLRVNLEKIERVFPHIATCGNELDRIELPAGDLLQQFWLEGIKELALGASVRFLSEHIRKTFALEKFSRMSPGAGAHDIWRIEEQRPLFSLFGNVDQLIGVRLTESCLMLPNKTVSGVFFPTEVTFQTCRLCPRKVCPSRQAPYDPAAVATYHETA